MENIKSYYVYLLLCRDKTYYTGITTNLTRRIWEHNYGKNGAKYTRSRRPVDLAYFEAAEDRSTALKQEHALRQLSHVQKKELTSSSN